MIPLRQTLEQIWHAYSGQAAWQTVADLSRFHRIQASPGFRQAAELIRQRLILDGLEAEILSYPANESAQFWTMQSFQEWHCSQATLHLVEPEKEAQELANFRACPISLVQRSISFKGEAEVVLLQDGAKDADYEGLEVAGKIVLTRGDLRRVQILAVEERGAIGILYDGMRVVPPVRPEGDLVDVRQYTSFWWKPGDKRCFGFVLTPRQGQALRRLLKKAETPVRVRAQIASELYDGAMEVVSAAIPGESDEEIIVVAHLCHPQPSANDNASGAAAALEAARTLQTLISKAVLSSPQRTIRFLWLPEINGMYAYLADREEELDRLVAGINLDMVGEDQNQTGSCWLIERPPDAASSFAPDLLVRLRDELPMLKGMTDVSPSHTGVGSWPLYRQAEVPFSGGSDHFVLSDPTVGVPTPMLIQWPDRFYHTAADTPDRTDPNSLARAGTLAAAYAYWLAAAGAKEAAWLGYEMVARFKKRLVETAQESVTQAQTAEDVQALARIMADLDRKLAYLLDRQQIALGTLQRLAPIECHVVDLQVRAQQATQQELAWVKGAIDVRAATLSLDTLPVESPADLSDEEQQAADLVPARQVRGPIELNDHLRHLGEKERQAWLQMLQAREGWMHHTLTNLALFWANGKRSVLEIADKVELESGQRDVELLLTYFRLLDSLGFVTMRPSSR
jgi:aminopeptidase YwaD